MCASAPPHSMAPMEEISRKCLSRSQGGGVRLYNGIVTFNNCEIYSNTADDVSFCPAPFHGPHGRSVQEASLAAHIGWWRLRLWIEHSGELQWVQPLR